ncbi:Crp/Fnr family transcriptional regulator [Candidatus Chlorohelix sp.]|uniref:Crp/Fnr family transcriptional regulator n=1 Tax=Candidatus Chlorohelix sp. TaxID=3139201 RepID=UPI00306055BE
MPEDLLRAICQTHPLVYQKWVIAFKRNLGDSLNDSATTNRHNEICKELLIAFRTGDDEAFLRLITLEGRVLARAGIALPALLQSLSEFFNLSWEILSATPIFERRPSLLLPLTERLNSLRSRAQTILLDSFTDEEHAIQRERTAEYERTLRHKLESMTVEELIRSIPSFRVVKHRKGHLVLEPGDYQPGLFFVLNGSVRIYEILQDGRAISLSILGKGDVFARTQTANTYFRDVYAEAMQDSVVAFIKEKSLENLMETSPLLASCVISSFSNQLSQSQSLIEGILGRSVALRLGRLLLKLADGFGVEQETGNITINLNLTHQELADMLGSNRVTVTRKLLELQKMSLISIDNHTISILDRCGLEKLAA